jgi:phosphatidate cytidylyltransferase
MARPLAPPAKPVSPLRLRIVSALVLGPLVLAMVWLRGAFLDALMLAAVALMGWEWARLAGRGAFGATGLAVIVAMEGAMGALALGEGGIACGVAAAGALLVGAMARFVRGEPAWAAGGTLWITLAALSFLWLAQMPGGGRETAFWLLGLVWANDIAAYAVGRAVGGPKLAHRWSPKKTWAGFFGGVISAGLFGLLWSGVVWQHNTSVAIVSALLAMAAQLGDLAESLAKRHFGVKDSSGLIPGHGGLLDRVDGLMAASMVAGAVSLAIGRGPSAW